MRRYYNEAGDWSTQADYLDALEAMGLPRKGRPTMRRRQRRFRFRFPRNRFRFRPGSLSRMFTFTWLIYCLSAIAGMFACDYLESHWTSASRYTAWIGLAGMTLDRFPAWLRSFSVGFFISSDFVTREYASIASKVS